MDIFDRLPSDLANRVTLYLSHPTAELIKESVGRNFHYYSPFSKTFSLADPEYLQHYSRIYFEDYRFRKFEQVLEYFGVDVWVGNRLMAVREKTGLYDIYGDPYNDSVSSESDEDVWLDTAVLTDPSMFPEITVLPGERVRLRF